MILCHSLLQLFCLQSIVAECHWPEIFRIECVCVRGVEGGGESGSHLTLLAFLCEIYYSKIYFSGAVTRIRTCIVSDYRKCIR